MAALAAASFVAAYGPPVATEPRQKTPEERQEAGGPGAPAGAYSALGAWPAIPGASPFVPTWPPAFNVPADTTDAHAMTALGLAAVGAEPAVKPEGQEERPGSVKRAGGGGGGGGRGKRASAHLEAGAVAALAAAAGMAGGGGGRMWPGAAAAAAAASSGSGGGSAHSTTGDLEALLSTLAQLKQGEVLTVAPVPLAVSSPEEEAPAGKRPRRAAARGALAVLQAEHHQAEAGPKGACFPELQGRLFWFSVAAAPAPAAATAAPWEQQQRRHQQQTAAAPWQQQRAASQEQQPDKVASGSRRKAQNDAAASGLLGAQQRQKQQQAVSRAADRCSAELTPPAEAAAAAEVADLADAARAGQAPPHAAAAEAAQSALSMPEASAEAAAGPGGPLEQAVPGSSSLEQQLRQQQDSLEAQPQEAGAHQIVGTAAARPPAPAAAEAAAAAAVEAPDVQMATGTPEDAAGQRRMGSRLSHEEGGGDAAVSGPKQEEERKGAGVDGEVGTGEGEAGEEMPGSFGDDSERDEDEDDVSGDEDEDDDSLAPPGSPTASEAALLNDLMQHQAALVAFQPEIALAFAANFGSMAAAAPGGDEVTSGEQELQRKAAARLCRGGRVGKRKGGMPPCCPGCGQAPLSEEDKRAASKRGRRKKNDETDPRNRKAELTRDFLVKHLVDARLSLRDICFYHGHCATTVSRVARNLGMELPSWRAERKAEPQQLPDANAGAVAAAAALAAAEDAAEGAAAAAGGGSGGSAAVQGLPEVVVLHASAEADSDAVALEALQALEAAAPHHSAALALPAALALAAQQQHAAGLAAATAARLAAARTGAEALAAVPAGDTAAAAALPAGVGVEPLAGHAAHAVVDVEAISVEQPAAAASQAAGAASGSSTAGRAEQPADAAVFLEPAGGTAEVAAAADAAFSASAVQLSDAGDWGSGGGQHAQLVPAVQAAANDASSAARPAAAAKAACAAAAGQASGAAAVAAPEAEPADIAAAEATIVAEAAAAAAAEPNHVASVIAAAGAPDAMHAAAGQSGQGEAPAPEQPAHAPGARVFGQQPAASEAGGAGTGAGASQAAS